MASFAPYQASSSGPDRTVKAPSGHQTAQDRRKNTPPTPAEWAGVCLELLRLVRADISTPRGGLYRTGLIERAQDLLDREARS